MILQIVYSKLMSFLFVMCAVSSHAQDIGSARNQYPGEIITRLNNNRFLKENRKLTFSDLRNEFSKSQVGFDLYQTARKHKTQYQIFRACSLISAIAGFSFVSANNRTGAITSFGGQLLFILFYGRARKYSRVYTDRALLERNRQLLFSK